MTAAALLLVAAGARADVVDIVWSTEGRYERVLGASTAKPLEVCGRLSTGSRIRWSFETDAPTAFNIHYHEGKRVHFAAQEERSQKGEGVLDVKQDQQDYCWMWIRKAAPASAVRVVLVRER